VGHPSLPLANPSRTLSFLSLARSRPLPCLSLWMLSHWRVPSFTASMLSLSLISQREGKVKITGKALIFPFNIWVKFVFFSSNLPCFLSLISHLSSLISQTCHVRDELLMILPLIYLILLHGSRLLTDPISIAREGLFRV